MSDYTEFRFKHFKLHQHKNVFKIGTDAMVLGSLIPADLHPKRILDIGTGTGVLGLMMAQKFPNAELTALEKFDNAFKLAQYNFLQNRPLSRNCKAVLEDFAHFTDINGFDLIISNPPYFIDSVRASSEVKDHSKHLVSSELKDFYQCVKRNLKTSGMALVIHPEDKIYEELSNSVGLKSQIFAEIYGKPGNLVRVVRVYAFEDIESKPKSLTIRNKVGAYTEEYKALTFDFHGVSL